MSTFAKRLLLCVIGIIAGAGSIPFTETALYNQELFPSYLVFTVFVGLVFGLFAGAFFSTGEGIFLNDKKKIFKGIFVGALIGVIGGVIGFLSGQFFLFIIGDKLLHSAKEFESMGLPLARSISWAVLGIFIGIIEGVRAGSGKKIVIGLIGGFLGGALGGLIFEALKYSLKDAFIARLFGLMIFGLLIGFFYGLIEKTLSNGVLRVLNGSMRGKEILVNQRKIKVGSSGRNDFVLSDYSDVDAQHALFQLKKDEVVVKNISKNKILKVNDDPVSEHKLRFEDVIKIGEAKFLYKVK